MMTMMMRSAVLVGQSSPSRVLLAASGGWKHQIRCRHANTIAINVMSTG